VLERAPVNNDEVRVALDDFTALTITLFGETSGEPIEGKIAVGNVIRNRVKAPRRFGMTYRAVCHAKGQFSCWFPYGGQENYDRVMRLARSFAEKTALPLPVASLAVFQECGYVAEGIIGGQLRDNTRGSTHYFAPRAMDPPGRVPDWAVGLIPTAKAGSQFFFAGVK
jgi:hypothetical protein